MKGVLSEYTDGSASKSKHPADMPLYLSYQISSCQIKCRRATERRGFGTKLELHKTRWTGSPAGDRSSMGGVSICWPTWPSSSRRTPFVVPRVSLLGICWPERSNGSTRRPQPPWIPTSCIPPGCNKCKCKCTACDSARACPVLPRLFFLPAYSTRAPTDRVAVIFDS